MREVFPCLRYAPHLCGGTLPSISADLDLRVGASLSTNSCQNPIWAIGHGDPRGGKSRGRAGNAEKNASSARCNDIGSIPEPKKKVWRAIKELTSGTSPKGRVPFDV